MSDITPPLEPARADPLLLTPGPLTTTATVKWVMQHDWGSRDADFIAMTRRVRERVVSLANAAETHTAILLQGSGTFVVEAMLGTFLPRDGKLLILVNGAYGRRMADICRVMGRTAVVEECGEDTPCDPASLARRLAGDPAITDVAVVHCETTSGILNPLADIAAVVAKAGRRLLIDAMSSFGALTIDAAKVPFTALAASANKCLQGVPGMGFVIADKARLAACEGQAHSLSLDLVAQWQGLEKDGQWRFTPPTHVVAALDQALAELELEGGVAARGQRYGDNCRALVQGMRALGFRTYLGDNLQAPVIVTFHMPHHPGWDFRRFYDALKNDGIVIYPGKLTKADSFRIGCIGDVFPADIHVALDAVRRALTALGVSLTSSAA